MRLSAGEQSSGTFVSVPGETNELKERYGAQVVSSPELQDILEHPERYDMPCLVPRGMTVNQVMARGEAYREPKVQTA